MAERRPKADLAELLALLRPHAVGDGSRLALGALLAVLVVALHVARPWPLKWVVDVVTGQGAPPSWLLAAGSSPAQLALGLCALFVTLALAGAGAEYAQTLLLNGLGNRVLYRFRAHLFQHLMRLPVGFHESRELGELLTRVVYDTSRLRRGVNGLLVRAFQTLALFAATLAVLFWIRPELGLVMATGGALALVAMRWSGRRIASAARKQRRKEGTLAALVAGELAGVRDLQAYGATDAMARERFDVRNQKSLGQEQKVRRMAAGLTFRVDALLALTVAVALLIGLRGATAGRLTAGDLVLFLSYALALRAPFVDFSYQTARLGRTYACADRLARIVDRVPDIVDSPGAKPAPPLIGSIAFEGVSVKAPRRRRTGRKWTLEDLTCAAPGGLRTAVVGGNGAGKSTLLRLVLRLTDPARGRVAADGIDLRDYSLESWRGRVSVVFQDSVFTGLTVRQNIALGAPRATLEAVRAAAASAHASDLIERLPQGYDTPVRRGGGLFSGGERQRLALARALLRDGTIWLLDEPTAGLDPQAAAELTSRLLEATRGRTTLWVTHDPMLLTKLDWVIALDAGRLRLSGPPDDYLDQHTGTPSTKSDSEEREA